MSNPHPKVSIILPTYNGARYLRESIDSCLKQTFQDFELIIVDDCSTDTTPEIIKSYTDPRIRYIRNAKNQRLPLSLNIGFAASRGELLTWTSDDNYYAPTAIAEMAAYLEANKLEFVYSDFDYVYADKNEVKVRHLQDAAESLRYEDCIGACFLYTRKVYEAVGNYDHDMEYVEDYDYWVRVFLKFPFGHIKKSLYHYRYHDMSISGTRRAEIEIMEFLLKLKYGFLNETQVNWFLRQQKLKTQKNPTILDKIANLKYKARISELLEEFKTTKAARETRNAISALLYDKKHYVFLRKFDPSWNWGGAELLLIDLFERIDHERCQVSLVVPSGAKKIFESRLTDKSKRVAIKEMPFSLRANAWQRFIRMFKFLTQLRPHEIIFVQGWYADFRCAEFFAAWLTARGNVYAHENSCPPLPPEKTSRTYAGGFKGLGLWWHAQKFFVRIKAAFCKKILTVSRNVGEELVKQWEYPENKMTVAYHGTDPRRYFPSPDSKSTMRKTRNIPEYALAVIVTSRLTQEKRIDRAIDAFDAAVGSNHNAFLLIAGQGPLESDLKARAFSKQSAGQIRFLGQLDDVAGLLQTGDIYLNTSDVEGFGLGLVEAMAAGLVCIATSSSGPIEIIDDNHNGFLAGRTADSVSLVLKKVLEISSAERQTIAAAARETVLTRFDVEKNTRQLLQLLQVPSRFKQ